MRLSDSGIGGCFPTGRHYPGIADRLARAIRDVTGLSPAFEPGAPWNELPLVVIDFETTGRDSSEDRVVEIGLVGFERGEVSFREGLLVDPERPIPAEATNVHGITDDEVLGAPKFREVLPRVVELLEGRLPVAYNADFDRGFLYAEARRALDGRLPERIPAFEESTVWADPLVWARELLDEAMKKKKTLSEVAAHLNVPLENAHRATGDAEATGHVLMRLAPKMPSTYSELIRLQQRFAAMQEQAFCARFRR
jgi:DNA polymerase III subunit epsilon